MKKQITKPLLIVGLLILLTAAGMAYTSGPKAISPDPDTGQGVVHLNGSLVQNKVYAGGDRTISMLLTMSADEVLPVNQGQTRNVDLVVVLDRSGSMEGQKISYAKQAVLQLLDRLTPQDRIALVSYSDQVKRHTGLLAVNTGNRSLLETAVGSIMAGGATNLSAGMKEGIGLLIDTPSTGNPGRLILISDGLANRGVTSIPALGRMADGASSQGEFAITTVGVGTDFNEQLMTSIADHGGGNYYFLENPRAFANVFQNELTNTVTAVATTIDVRIPLENGWSLVNAAGYPIDIQNGFAVFHPGSLRSGQTRKFFLTLKVPDNGHETHFLKGIGLSYIHDGKPREVLLDQTFEVAVVSNVTEAAASIDKGEWEQKVIQEDYNRLLEEVAHDIKDGKKEAAMDKIDEYYSVNQSANQAVGSAAVKQNLDHEVENLRQTVNDSFQGTAEEKSYKQKATSKKIQFEGYQKRRAKQVQ